MSRYTSIVAIAMTGSLALVGRVCLGGEAHQQTTTPKFAEFEACRCVVHVSGSQNGFQGPLKMTIYLSDIMGRGPVNDEDISLAYRKFVREKYGQEDGLFECVPAWTRDEAQHTLDVIFRQGYESQTFIPTGWQYKPAPKGGTSGAKPGPAATPAQVATAAQSATPTPVAAPAPSQYAACWANMNATVKYYSSVFDGSRDDARQWVPAFSQYLQQQHGFNGPVQCIPGRSEADAQAYMKALLDKDRATRTMDGSPPKIVETGWKY